MADGTSEACHCNDGRGTGQRWNGRPARSAIDHGDSHKNPPVSPTLIRVSPHDPDDGPDPRVAPLPRCDAAARSMFASFSENDHFELNEILWRLIKGKEASVPLTIAYRRN